MIGAEESGGYGFGMHLPERDGIYADLLLLDLFLRERARGNWPVSRAVELFHEIAGPSFYRRIDVHVERPPYDGVKERVLVRARRTSRPPSWRASRSSGRRSSPRTTASSGSSPTARGCSSARAAPSRSSGSTRRRRSPSLRDELVLTGERVVRGG